MPILGQESATRRRFGTETADPDTGATIKPSPVVSSFRGSFQPLNGRDLQTLPEGKRTSETLKVYTKTDLRTADQFTGTPADDVEYKGKLFEVYVVMEYPQLLNHFKALLTRKQER